MDFCVIYNLVIVLIFAIFVNTENGASFIEWLGRKFMKIFNKKKKKMINNSGQKDNIFDLLGEVKRLGMSAEETSKILREWQTK